MITRKAISPIIAELLIVTLAIVISIGVIGYVMGWFSWGAGKTESVYVYPDGKLFVDRSNNSVYAVFRVYSNYKPSIALVKIYMSPHIEASEVSVLEVYQGGPVRIEDSAVILPDGTEALLKVTFDATPDQVVPDIPGKKEVYIITSEGFLVKAYLKIEYRG